MQFCYFRRLKITNTAHERGLFYKDYKMETIIITSAFTSFIVSLLVHWFTITQVTKWFDKFFFEQNQIMEKYADDIKEIIHKRKS